MKHNTFLEPAILTRYLINEENTETDRQLYQQGLAELDLSLTEKEEKLWIKIMKNPWLISFYDSGLAIMQPGSNIRGRIFLMLCILESNPLFSDKFLQKRYTFLDFISLIYKVIRAVSNTLAGLPIVYLWIRKA